MTLGDTIHLYSTVTGAYPALTYSWTPDTGLSCNNCPNPMLIPNDYDTVITWYKLSVTYNNGCLVTDSASILAKPNDLIGIPDAFTPNGDNMNPEFKILATSVKSFRMTIYDRWGQQVFAANDITQGWDGTFKGTPQPTGMYTYFFSLTYINGKVVNKEGTLSLFR
jgi:gliding motility-associated-like protein